MSAASPAIEPFPAIAQESAPIAHYSLSRLGERLEHTRRFWHFALALRGAATLRILPNVVLFGLISASVYLLDSVFKVASLAIEVGPHEVGGALLGLLLVLRTNAGYERWWEARKLWGGIVNQSRNLVIEALAYGPDNPKWRDLITRWTAAFPHVSRASLRGERDVPEIVPLLGPQSARAVTSAQHMPVYVAYVIGALLREARDRMGMSEFGFLEINRNKAQLIDHVGACERILKTPLARVYSIKISRFIFFFLATLPFALLHKLENGFLMPLVTMLIAYVVLGLDQIGVELQNPFAKTSLSHLPLDEISDAIEKNLLAIQKEDSHVTPEACAARLLGFDYASQSGASTRADVLHFDGTPAPPAVEQPTEIPDRRADSLGPASARVLHDHES